MLQRDGLDYTKLEQPTAEVTQTEKYIPGLTFGGQPVRRDNLLGVYLFFLFHMGIFGLSGFLMAYFMEDLNLLFLYMHGGLAIFVYTIFYLSIFGKDAVKWMFINAGLGILGLYAQIGWILERFGKHISDFPLVVHAIPFLYIILYTFLIRQIFIDLTGARKDPGRLVIANMSYIVVSIVVSIGGIFLSWQ